MVATNWTQTARHPPSPPADLPRAARLQLAAAQQETVGELAAAIRLMLARDDGLTGDGGAADDEEDWRAGLSGARTEWCLRACEAQCRSSHLEEVSPRIWANGRAV